MENMIERITQLGKNKDRTIFTPSYLSDFIQEWERATGRLKPHIREMWKFEKHNGGK